ncbi:hypothetical protein C8J57DRAFT_1253649 [Mycena rebaudengoi]|nr:hypothetical protein C8J57DRAFT_1253649 [Mycena rebaudengoi]
MEYKAIVSKELFLSPVSTVPGLYDGMPVLRTNMEKLMFLHKENLHHSNSLLKGFHNTEFPWLANWMLALRALTAAVLEHFPEMWPATIFYHQDMGEQLERVPPARSSWQAGKSVREEQKHE